MRARGAAAPSIPARTAPDPTLQLGGLRLALGQLSQVLAQYLAGWAAGNRVDERDAAPELLVVGDLALDVGGDVGLGEAAACRGREDDIGTRGLGVLIGDADDGRVGNRRVGDEDALELGRGDLEALVLDELLAGTRVGQSAGGGGDLAASRGRGNLFAIDKVQEIPFHAEDVAGAEPSIAGEGVPVGLGVVVVTLGDHGPLDERLPGLARLDVVIVVVYEPAPRMVSARPGRCLVFFLFTFYNGGG